MTDHRAAQNGRGELYAIAHSIETERERRRSQTASAADDTQDHGLGAVPSYPRSALPPQAQALLGTLPDALIGGAALAALAAAVGGATSVKLTDTWPERPILWVANLAPRGAGKSPAQTITFQRLRDHEGALGDDDPPLLLGDLTLEAVARDLAASDGAAAVDVDELAQLVRGLGEYKGHGGDRGRMLSLWSGAPWSYRRVGTGKQTNGVALRITRPTLVICGGLQPALHPLLGGDEDGMRPRWLPHLAQMGNVVGSEAAPTAAWSELLEDLLDLRARPREWQLSDQARRTFEHRRFEWKAEARGAEAPSVTAALIKADVHLARIALVLAEADRPGHGGAISATVMERAAEIVAFTLDCWRALPDQSEGLGLSRRDQMLSRAVVKLAAWLEERPERRASRREIQRAHVAGVRTPDELNALLAEYEATYSGSVTEAVPSGGGRPILVVGAPRRTQRISVSPHVDTQIVADENSRTRAKSRGVTTGDTAPGDTVSGDTVPDDLAPPDLEWE